MPFLDCPPAHSSRTEGIARGWGLPSPVGCSDKTRAAPGFGEGRVLGAKGIPVSAVPVQGHNPFRCSGHPACPLDTGRGALPD